MYVCLEKFLIEFQFQRTRQTVRLPRSAKVTFIERSSRLWDSDTKYKYWKKKDWHLGWIFSVNWRNKNVYLLIWIGSSSLLLFLSSLMFPIRYT